jgi:hypothetical protein
MILAVPMTVIIRIVCENITYLEPVSIILASQRSLTLKSDQAGAKAQTGAEGDGEAPADPT